MAIQPLMYLIIISAPDAFSCHLEIITAIDSNRVNNYLLKPVYASLPVKPNVTGSLCHTLSQQQEGGVMYLENAFLRTENGESYVYVRGGDNRLEKRVVQTGDSSDGYSTQILSGLSETDYIAFPYGKSVREGAPTREGTREDLYG